MELGFTPYPPQPLVENLHTFFLFIETPFRGKDPHMIQDVYLTPECVGAKKNVVTEHL